jgi:stearoyl-CoA desaturase (delta-9 desaturase)
VAVASVTAESRRIGRFFDRTAIVLGVLVPPSSVVIAAILTWNRLTTWRDLAIFAGMFVATSLGITIGFHRMLTHRSFQAHPVPKFILLALGTMAGMTDPVRWTAIHLQHHAKSDREGDPHSPLNGLFHAHMGWWIPGFDADQDTYARRAREDPMVRFFQRTFWGWMALTFLIPFLLGGWTGMLWGTGVRAFFAMHLNFSVNSICHTFGRVDFATNDRSRNHWLLGLLAFGEGWHNNHHAFPRSARHGLLWWQIDISGYLILGLEKLGLARDVHRVSPQLLDARRLGPASSKES